MRKSTYNVETTTVVGSDGSVVQMESVKKQRIKINSESFYMVFIDHVAPFFNLKNGTSKSVLGWLCNKAVFNTGQVSLSAADRTNICKELEISKNVLSISLKELVSKRLITGERGSYTINPQIFWKGDLLARDNLLQVEEIQVAFKLNLDKNKKKENSDIQPNDDFAVKEGA